MKAVEEEIALPQLKRGRTGLGTPKSSTSRRVPLAGAELLRRYENSNSSKSEPRAPISPSTSRALAHRTEFASKMRAGSAKTPSSRKTRSKDISSAAKSDSTLSRGAGGMKGAGPIAIDSDIRTTSGSMSHSGGGGGAGSSGNGWDDNFGDGDDNHGHGNNGCNNCNNGHWCNDHWHGGWYNDHWRWNSWGYHYGSWCGWYGWYGWWRYSLYYPYYSPGWSTYYAPTVVSSTIHTTEVIEIPVVQEVFVPLDNDLITGAEVSSPAEVQSALQRASVEYLSLGDRAFAETRYGDAVRHYARAVECAPEDPVLQLVLSDALFATGDYHYAAHCLRRALELEPNLLEVEFDKRSFYGDPSDFDRHLLLLQSYLADHVLDDDARLLLGANFLFGGNPDGTITLFSDAFSETVRNSDAGRLLLAAAHRAIAAR